MNLLFNFERKSLSENIFETELYDKSFNLDICFNAKGIFDFLWITFHTLLKPPFPIIYWKSNWDVDTIK